jgi:hypothetical protein
MITSPLFSGFGALIVAAPVYFFSSYAAWWAFFCVFGLLMFGSLSKALGPLSGLSFVVFLVGVTYSYYQGGWPFALGMPQFLLE